MPAASEPYWLAEDTAYALAWQQLQALRCPGCGQPRDESMAAEHADAYRVRAIRCHACAARDRRVQADGDHAGHDPAGLNYLTELDREVIPHA